MQDGVTTINGRSIEYEPGQTILEAAKANGITIPTLCYLEGAKAIGGCGVCVVEDTAGQGLVRACSTAIQAGMRIRTESKSAVQARREALTRLVSSGQHNCFITSLEPTAWTEYQNGVMTAASWHQTLCPSWGRCELQNLIVRYGVDESTIPVAWEMDLCPLDDEHPMFVRDYSRCIRCGRCIQACNDIQGNMAIPVPEGWDPETGTTNDNFPVVDYEHCVHCGECVQACPVGALFEKKSFGLEVGNETNVVRTTCPYCGVGCQQHLHVKDDRIIRVTGVKNGSPNKGRLCVKGRFGYDFIYSEERLTSPLIRKNGYLREATWDEALDYTADRLKEIIKEHGPDSIAGISCARSINEDSYQMQKLFRAVFKTNNIDHCARTCHAPTVAGLATSFGSGAMTNSFADFPKAKLFFVIGSNTTEAHPVAATFIKQAVQQNGAELIVVDPRRTGMVPFATSYLQLKVGSDIALLNGLMHVLIEEDLYDKEYVAGCTTGFEELKAKVMEYPPSRAADISGIPEDVIRDTARKMASIKPAMLVYTLGITEHTCGVNNVMSTANLQMLLGNVGFECSGVNPLRGQNNVQGACDMGALPNVYHGYQKVIDPVAKEKFEAAWGVEGLDDKNGLMIPAMFDGILDGSVQALYVFGENVANTEPDIHHVEKCLDKAPFLICQDIFPNETTRFADVVFPAAAWSENDGTFTNSERRVNRVRTASPPPGLAKPNWWIFKELARRFGQEWQSSSAQEIWDNEISEMAPSLKGIKYHRIEGDGLQWPVPDLDHPGTPFLHKDGCFVCGLGNFVPIDWTPPAEVPDDEYPLVLSTGRRLYHYHTRTQTGRCEGLNDLLGEETADMSVQDAEKLGVSHGDWVKVASRRGAVKVRAKVSDNIRPGMVWMAFHFREGNANWLTNTAFDPVSQTAEFKACAVRLEKALTD